MSPLETVHGPKVAFASMTEPALLQKLLGTVPIPDLDSLVRQNLRVGLPTDEPQKLLDNAP
jgi:hypothetical protein